MVLVRLVKDLIEEVVQLLEDSVLYSCQGITWRLFQSLFFYLLSAGHLSSDTMLIVPPDDPLECALEDLQMPDVLNDHIDEAVLLLDLVSQLEDQVLGVADVVLACQFLLLVPLLVGLHSFHVPR